MRGWKTRSILALFALLSLLGSGGFLSPTAGAAPLPQVDGPVDVVLIIDSSGSMSSTDPNGKRRDAARAYLTASLVADYVGVVDFDSTATITAPLSRIPERKADLTSAIAKIDASGGTNIADGMIKGCAALQQSVSGNSRKAAILLTDGEHNEGPYGTADSCFTAKGWPVFAFGFGSANDSFLTGIAQRTNGEYKRLTTQNLLCEFQGVREKIAGKTPKGCTTVTVLPNQTVTGNTVVPAAQVQATFAASWNGSNITLKLTSPTGRVIDTTTVAPDVAQDRGTGFHIYTIRNPQAGTWQYSLSGTNVPAGGQQVVISTTNLPVPTFCDVNPSTQYYDSINALTSRGIIKGYDDGCFYPTDFTLRSHMAVLIVRAMGWSGESATPPFTDRSGIGDELWRSIGILANHGVAKGYGDGTYRPLDDILRVQTISFISRAMVAKGWWQAATQDDPAIYPNIPASSAHRLDVVTYANNVGLIPGTASTTAAWDGAEGWDKPATRGWFAEALWLAVKGRIS